VTRLAVTVTDGRGRRVPDHGLPAWLQRAAPPGARGSVGIALVSDAAMRRLNRDYRRLDYATDVLSFPADGHPGPGFGPFDGLRARPLGDLAIALGVARRQAREHGHALRTELRVLALHGILHLLGYDHDTDRGQMQRLEERLRRRAGLPSGLIARPRARTGRR